MLVLSAVDPAFNAAPDTFDLHDYLATYWLINGKAYPDTAPIRRRRRAAKVLLRYLNAGYDNTTMALLGMHQHVVARDAPRSTTRSTPTPRRSRRAATEDAIVTMPATPPPSANGFPLYNRQLHVTNGTAEANPDHTPGGMLTFITP